MESTQNQTVSFGFKIQISGKRLLLDAHNTSYMIFHMLLITNVNIKINVFYVCINGGTSTATGFNGCAWFACLEK